MCTYQVLSFKSGFSNYTKEYWILPTCFAVLKKIRMTSSSDSNSLSDPTTTEQVINHFFAKTLHNILEARSPYVQSQNYNANLLDSSLSRDKCFNLAMENPPSALANFGKWHRNHCEQLVIDIILIQDKCEKIVERWIIQYDSPEGKKLANESDSMYEIACMKTIILLRTLYAILRFLPAYKVFRELNLSRKVCNYSLSHKISTFVQPFTREEESEMKDFNFVPIETPCGVLSLSISYKATIDFVSSKASFPMSVQIIPDYVGSSNIDFIRKLNVLPSVGSLPTYISLMQKRDLHKEYKAPSSFPITSSNTHMEDNSLSLLSKINMTIKKYSCTPQFSLRGFFGQGLPMKKGSGESNAYKTLQKKVLEKDDIGRSYLMDEIEDKHFCPFAEDDEISILRAQPDDNIGTNNLVKYEDAFYGVLVKKLKASTPIRKKPWITYADSIKELRSYDEIIKLLRQGGLRSLHAC